MYDIIMNESQDDTIEILLNLTRYDIIKINYREFCIRYHKAHSIIYITNKYGVKIIDEKYKSIVKLMDTLKFHYE
jgi:hypothetical protein